MLLSLTEYGAATKGRWPSSFLSALREESQKWKIVLGLREQPFLIEYVDRGVHSIRARGIAGFLNVEDTAIEVRPKFLSNASDHSWRRALWQILTVVEDEPYLEAASTAAIVENEDSFSDLLGWILLDSVRLARLEGLPRGYSEERGALSVLRGRIDLSRIVDMISRPYVVPCVYDNFSENIPLNRLIRWASSQLALMVNSPRLGRLLTDEADGFAGIDSLPPGIVEAERISLPVQYQHLDPALHVSRLLLRRQSLQHAEDEFRAPGFLWKSSEVFELFVGHLLQRVIEDEPSWRVESSQQLLAFNPNSRRRIPTRPDYRVVTDRGAVTVLDAKYKVWRKNQRPMVQDVYQVMAAGRINNCPIVFLVYPLADNAEPKPLTWSIVGAGQPNRLAAVFIDLSIMALEDGERILVQTFHTDIRTTLSTA